MAYVKKNNLPGGDKRVTNDPMEATYIGIHMWAQAVEQAKTHQRRRRPPGDRLPALQGAVGLRHRDGREEPPPAQAGLHRRGQGRRPVPGRVEDRRRRSAPRPGARSSPTAQKKVGRLDATPWACGNCTAPKFGAALARPPPHWQPTPRPSDRSMPPTAGTARRVDRGAVVDDGRPLRFRWLRGMPTCSALPRAVRRACLEGNRPPRRRRRCSSIRRAARSQRCAHRRSGRRSTREQLEPVTINNRFAAKTLERRAGARCSSTSAGDGPPRAPTRVAAGAAPAPRGVAAAAEGAGAREGRRASRRRWRWPWRALDLAEPRAGAAPRGGRRAAAGAAAPRAAADRRSGWTAEQRARRVRAAAARRDPAAWTWRRQRGRDRRQPASPACSLASVLLFAALGLAVTFGLMGVINMAHGEMLMLGAYATYAVQDAFRRLAPLRLLPAVAAIPVAFLAAALVGRAARARRDPPPLRPAAGDAARHLGHQPAADPDGAPRSSARRTSRSRTRLAVGRARADARPGAALEPHRVVGFVGRWSLARRRGSAAADAARAAGARGHPEPAAWPRASASAPRASTRSPSASARGSRAWAACALSQLGNVGPELGQGYIIDSFMVVVLGGVGQLAGTVAAALGPRHRQQAARAGGGRGAGKDRRARLHHPLHPAAPAGPVRAEGPGGGREHATVTLAPRSRLAPDALARAPVAVVLGVTACWCSIPVLHLACRQRRRCTSPTTWSRCSASSSASRSRARDGSGVGLRRHPQPGPRPLLRARRLRDGHVPDALDRRRGRLPERAARLHGVPRLEAAALVLARLPQLRLRAGDARGAGARRCWRFVFGWFAFRSRIRGVYFSIVTQALTYAAMLLFFQNADRLRRQQRPHRLQAHPGLPAADAGDARDALRALGDAAAGGLPRSAASS